MWQEHSDTVHSFSNGHRLEVIKVQMLANGTAEGFTSCRFMEIMDDL